MISIIIIIISNTIITLSLSIIPPAPSGALRSRPIVRHDVDDDDGDIDNGDDNNNYDNQIHSSVINDNFYL